MTRLISLCMICVTLIGFSAANMTGCENLPGNRTEQATVIGGASGAVLGAVLAKENRLLGALIGGALGAGGGYLIGAKTDWFGKDKNEVKSSAQAAANKAQKNPATADEARRANTADINGDGFVTMDEIIAMERAGLSDSQIIQHLERTGQVFDLSEDQRQVLLDNGVSRHVVDKLPEINRDERDRLLSSRSNSDVVSHPRD